MNLVKDIVVELNAAIVTAVGGLVVAVLIRTVSKFSERRKDALAEHLSLRHELREELDTVKKELYVLQQDVNEWREKYYHQIEINAALRLEVEALRHELDEYKNNTGETPTT